MMMLGWTLYGDFSFVRAIKTSSLSRDVKARRALAVLDRSTNGQSYTFSVQSSMKRAR